MHRTEGLGHVANKFAPGDPLVPRFPTKLDHTILNALQEEIAGPIEAAGIPLRTMADDVTAGYASQLLEAIEKLNPVKAACVVDGTILGSPVLLAGAGVRNVSGVTMEPIASGGSPAPKRFRVNFNSPIGTPIAAAITSRDVPALTTTNIVTFPNVWRLTSTYVEFFVPLAAILGSPVTMNSAVAVDSYAMMYDVVVIGTGA